MPLPIIADVFRTVFIWRDIDSGTNAINVMHISAPGATEEDVLDTVFASVATRGTAMFAALSGGCFVERVEVEKLDGTSARHSRNTAGATTPHWQGQGSGGSIVAAAAIIKLSTALRGRSNRGRLYLPSVAESKYADGVLDTVAQTSMTTGWDAFANDLVADTMALGVASYRHANWHQAVGIVCESAVGTQRRRQNQLRV
jgi:hypothetical protein